MCLILWWENIHIYFFNCNKTHTHISFSVIFAGILRAVGNLAVRFVCRMRSTFANRRIAHALSESLPLIFRGKTSAAFPDGSSIPRIDFYVNQTDSVLNFARGHTPADDTCVYCNVY